jgi:mono/diheme cytochrome c family protein
MPTVDFHLADKSFHFGVLLFGILFFSAGCTSKSGRDSSPKFEQYYVQGEQLYIQHCSNCHQENGSGLGRLYPPLDTSDYMQNYLEDVVCLIRNGKEGELKVNGESFNQKMPAVPITDLEIAEITTYIYNTWSHRRGLVEVKLVSEILKSCDSLSSN